MLKILPVVHFVKRFEAWEGAEDFTCCYHRQELTPLLGHSAELGTSL